MRRVAVVACGTLAAALLACALAGCGGEAAARQTTTTRRAAPPPPPTPSTGATIRRLALELAPVVTRPAAMIVSGVSPRDARLRRALKTALDTRQDYCDGLDLFKGLFAPEGDPGDVVTVIDEACSHLRRAARANVLGLVDAAQRTVAMREARSARTYAVGAARLARLLPNR